MEKLLLRSVEKHLKVALQDYLEYCDSDCNYLFQRKKMYNVHDGKISQLQELAT